MDNTRENENLNPAAEPQEEGYTPRPTWQGWGARVGLVLFILFVIYQLVTIAGGGL